VAPVEREGTAVSADDRLSPKVKRSLKKLAKTAGCEEELSALHVFARNTLAYLAATHQNDPALLVGPIREMCRPAWGDTDPVPTPVLEQALLVIALKTKHHQVLLCRRTRDPVRPPRKITLKRLVHHATKDGCLVVSREAARHYPRATLTRSAKGLSKSRARRHA
jgi:hypothetical protein